jgi:hypothetical protein
VIRLEDLSKEGFDWIWRIDNHQLLQKYLPDESKPHESATRKWYKKSNRYTGWFSSEGFRFVALEPKQRENKDELVSDWLNILLIHMSHLDSRRLAERGSDSKSGCRLRKGGS